MIYRILLLLMISSVGCNTSKKVAMTDSSVLDSSAEDLQEMLANGSLTSVQLTQMYIDRIAAVDKDGPKINSVLLINPDALTIAQQMDDERKSGKVRGPMHGLPVLIKDNIDTHDKMPNTAGSLAFKDNMPKADAHIVKQLRKSGAVLLGKANLSEWANFRSTGSSSGWSSINGQTGNPHNMNKSPCGSSAGSGAAVAARLCVVAIGTETNGSIGCPASVNGVVGIKPTVGLWSRSGIIPISHTQDTAGPMARSVKDAAALLQACAAVDPSDEATREQSVGKYLEACQANGMKGKRIGIDSSYFEIEGDMGDVFMEAVKAMEDAGAEIVKIDVEGEMDYEGLGPDEYSLLLYEFKDGLNKYLAGSDLPFKNLQDLIDFNIANAETVMPIFKQEIFDMAQAKGMLSDTAYVNAKKRLMKHTRGTIDKLTTEQNLDAIVGPTTGPAWDIDHENGDKFNGPSAYGIAAISGYPHINVPMGAVDGLPVGICFIGQAWTEASLINVAYNYEQISNKIITPNF